MEGDGQPSETFGEGYARKFWKVYRGFAGLALAWVVMILIVDLIAGTIAWPMALLFLLFFGAIFLFLLWIGRVVEGGQRRARESNAKNPP